MQVIADSKNHFIYSGYQGIRKNVIPQGGCWGLVAGRP